MKWKQHQGPGATYRKLIMAFEEAHRLDLADVVDRLAGKVTSDQAQGTSDYPAQETTYEHPVKGECVDTIRGSPNSINFVAILKNIAVTKAH